jgi:hypothetical protein
MDNVCNTVPTIFLKVGRNINNEQFVAEQCENFLIQKAKC